MTRRKIRVIQYGLGPIGLETLRLALTKEHLEVVGAVDIAREMVGRDLGDVLSLGREIGIKVTDNPRALFAASRADVVLHTAGSRLRQIMPQLEEIVKAKLHIVSSSEELLYPRGENLENAARLGRLAGENGVTVLGTGVNPGFVMDALPAYLTSVCQEVRKIEIERVVDASTRRYPLQKKIGAGMAPEVFRQKMEEKAMGHVGLSESLYLLAGACGFKLEETEETVEPVFSPRPVKTAYFDIKEGDIAGIKNLAWGRIKGEAVITLDLRMYIGAPDPHDAVRIDGNPSLKVRIEGGVPGDQATSAILINSIPSVLAGRRGLISVLDLPVTHILR